MQGFGQVGGADALCPGQVGNGAGHLQHPVVGPGGKPHAAECPPHEGAGLRLQQADFAQGPGGQLGVAVDPFQPHGGVTGALNLPGGLHPGADGRAGLALGLAGKLVVAHRGHLYLQVDAVQQGAADALLIAGNGAGWAGAGMGRVAVIAAGAWVHGGHQHKAAGEYCAARHPAHRYLAILHGLTQNLQCVPLELRQFVQKQHTVVG